MLALYPAFLSEARQNKRTGTHSQPGCLGNPVVEVIQKGPTHCMADFYLCAISLPEFLYTCLTVHKQ